MRSHVRRSHVRELACLLWCAASVLGCQPPLRTDTLVSVFNGGVIDTSNGDPFRTDAERRADIVTRAMKQELIDGFFAQGRDHGLPYSVGDWLANAGDDVDGFYDLLVAWACDRRVRIGESCLDAAPQDVAVADQTAVMSVPPSLARSRLLTHQTAERWSGGPTQEPLCTSSGRDPETLRRFTDAVRFEAALDRTLPIVGELLIERLVDKQAVLRGGARAFFEAAGYLRSRAWHRQLDVLTTGLVVKGGASTGIYSAGVVWVALRLIDRCARDPDCRRGQDLRLALLSGTSTGALIAAAVDMFNTGDPWRNHQRELDNLAYWFTCKSTPDLYCVQSRSAFSLVEDQRGLVRFDGIEDLLAHNLQCDELQNRSELIANSVDFRTGALYAFSDQDPSEMGSPRDVIDGVLASALLPFVGNPIDRLPWTRGEPQPGMLDEKRLSAYLDGGVRSELPVLPIARRGAERVLVVSSAASVLGETGPLEDAADILVRYINVSTGGVTESELGHAQRWVESARLREIDLCKERAKQGACGAGCDEEELCEARFSRVCDTDRAVEEAVAPTPAAGPSGEPSERATDRLHRFWRMTSFFRDELSVAPSRGYAFERGPHRSLFHAGAEAARVRCLELALTLGVIPRDRKLDPTLRRKLVDWCSEPLPSEDALCHGEPAGAKPLECEDPPYGARRASPSSDRVCERGGP